MSGRAHIDIQQKPTGVDAYCEQCEDVNRFTAMAGDPGALVCSDCGAIQQVVRPVNA